jgi:outer membrane receptor protein involved in Fe transport
MEYFPIPGWKIFGNFYSFKGVSQLTKDPLNDIPAAKLFLGTRVWKGNFWGEINASFQKEKKNPGPAEISISGHEIVNFQAGFFLNSTLKFYFSVSNLLDRTYVARPDPETMEAPGRNFTLGLHYSF